MNFINIIKNKIFFKQKVFNYPVLFESANFLSERYAYNKIVCLGSNYLEEILQYCKNNKIIVVDDPQTSNKNVKKYNLEGVDIKFISIKEIKKISKIFNHSIVLIPGFDGENTISKQFIINLLSIKDNSIVSLISFQNKLDDQSIKRFEMNHGFRSLFWGYTKQNSKNEDEVSCLIIDNPIYSVIDKRKNKKILAIISSYNEIDILPQVIENFIRQDIYVHCIDNWSTDKTKKYLEQLSNKNKFVTYSVYPLRKENEFDMYKMLEEKVRIAEHSDADWILHTDADEIRVSPFEKFSLKDSIEIVDSLGFNAIDYTCIDFKPIIDRFDGKQKISSFFKYFEFGLRPGHFIQIKTWKNRKNVRLANSGGHRVEFPSQNIFPYKFLLKHYPIRSNKQGRRKVYERKVRREKERRERGWGVQYNKYFENIEKQNFIESKDKYLLFDNCFKRKYFLERLFGLGLKRQ